MKIFAAITLVLASSMFAQTPSSAPQKHPFTFEDMMKLKRVGAPVPSTGWQMGRVRLRRCRSGSEQEDFAFVDRAGERR